MSRKRGLSVEEKRTRMMEFFYEKKDFFSLKELEKLCQKEKGITSMSVKEILTSLVDDGMVDTDKIGTSVYFWAFPSKASQNRKQKLDGLARQLDELDKKTQSLKEAISKARVGKEESEGRSEVLAQLAQVQGEQADLLAQLAQYRDSDPEVLAQMQRESGVSKEAADRWTDNIFSLKSWIKRKFSFEESVIDKQFGIPEDLDYLD